MCTLHQDKNLAFAWSDTSQGNQLKPKNKMVKSLSWLAPFPINLSTELF